MKNWISFVLLLTLTTSPAWADEAENFAMAHVRLSTEPTMATGCLRVGQVMGRLRQGPETQDRQDGGDTEFSRSEPTRSMPRHFGARALPGHLIRAQRRLFHLHRQEFHHHLLPSSRGRPRTCRHRLPGGWTDRLPWGRSRRWRRYEEAEDCRGDGSGVALGLRGPFGIIRARRVRVSDRSGPLRKDRGTWHANLGICEVCP